MSNAAKAKTPDILERRPLKVLVFGRFEIAREFVQNFEHTMGDWVTAEVRKKGLIGGVSHGDGVSSYDAVVAIAPPLRSRDMALGFNEQIRGLASLMRNTQVLMVVLEDAGEGNFNPVVATMLESQIDFCFRKDGLGKLGVDYSDFYRLIVEAIARKKRSLGADVPF